MKPIKKLLLLTSFLFLLGNLHGQNKKEEFSSNSIKDISLNGLSFRSIGPAITGGRVVALAVNPFNYSEYYVGSGHGSLWKTTNNGITFTSIFDNENSYAIGAIALDPTNPNIVWVGTGENNNQTNVIHGDGVYKSEDGGKNWKNMGLKNSFHIGGIVVDPNNPQTVFVAAYGALRNGNKERGIFKTTDGGQTWKKVLFISEYTGCYQVHMDSRNSDILYAVAHQRMNKLFTSVRGGSESGIYRSIDSGETWTKMTTGLPSENVGRIGLAISPVNPDIVFAIIEAKEEGGVYRSSDRGASWVKKSSYVSRFPFYFQKIFCDTKDVDRVYSMDVLTQVTIDGGTTWKDAGEAKKHVDNHVLWIDPKNNKHMINGCDGGVYETYDQAKNWDFKANIPISEIYKVTTDNARPFYNVFIGTQDNHSLGGPSRTINSSGISNRDWFFTKSGDGFQTQVDWKDPNIIYSQAQYGSLVRYNKKTGEKIVIRPYASNDSIYRFDWDSPLLISQYDNKKLYLGANKLFRTKDMGNTWEIISPDLTRGVPNKMLDLMERSWSIDELAYKGTMGQISTIAESTIDQNLLYIGSGDGLIHYTKDSGANWTKSSTPGLPKHARVSQIIASQFDENVAYAACQNFIDGDFKPYIYKTIDQGKSWFLFNGNLPTNGCTYTLAQDDVNKDLLFVGTQFGVFFTYNGGEEWIQLKNGIPTSCVKSLVIQKRESDLVVSTFGRGVYILDNYRPLRHVNTSLLNKEAYLFPVKEAKMFNEANPFAYPNVAFQGASFYSASNPEVGAVFTYYLKDEFKTLKGHRRNLEKDKQKKNEKIKYPSYEQLLNEKLETPSYLLFTVTNENGDVIRKLKTDPKKGINRITWDFRHHSFEPISLDSKGPKEYWQQADVGYMAPPGKYKVTLSKFANNQFTALSAPQEFTCQPLKQNTISEEERLELDKFNAKVATLVLAISGVDSYRKSLVKKIAYFENAIIAGSKVPNSLYQNILTVKNELDSFNRVLNGDPLIARYKGAFATSLKQRVDMITSGLWRTTALPTTTFKDSYNVVSSEFSDLLKTLKAIDTKIKLIESNLNDYEAPYTPHRFPEWKESE